MVFHNHIGVFRRKTDNNNGNPRQGGLPQIWYFPFEPSHAAEEVVYAFLTITYQYLKLNKTIVNFLRYDILELEL